MKANADRFIARHVAELPRSGIRDFFTMVSEMPEVISLGIGEPDFVTPWRIREAAIFALERGKTSYTDNLGLLHLRRTVSSYLQAEFAIEYQPENEILITAGVSEALDIALRAVINPGDKVLYHEPCYVAYSPSVRLAHGDAIAVPTRSENGFGLDFTSLERAWQPGCKALILNFPTNPTGAVASPDDLENFARFVAQRDLLVISDEIYAELTYKGNHSSIAALPGMKDRTIFLHGVSKAFAMTGFRIGFACGPKALIEAMMKIHQYALMCAPIVSQEAAIEALKGGKQSVLEMREQYHRRREFIVRRLNEIGLPCGTPGGTFYAFPSVRETGLDDVEFCHRLLREERVALVPGSAFGRHGEGFVRVSFSAPYQRLLAAADGIERLVGRCSRGE